jgi:5-methylcytosine-specific restriction endonuclease McrA
MLSYCIRHLKYSEPAAEKRLHAARVAHAHPVLFEMLCDGRMSLTTILALSSHLKGSGADELIAEAAGKSRSEIEYLLARRAPRNECFEWGTEASAATVTDGVTDPAPGRGSAADSGAPASGKATLTPISEARVALQVTVRRATQEKLLRAKELLGFEVAANDTAEVLDRALDALIHVLEKQRFGKHTKHRAAAVPAQDPRHIPSEMREDVAQRDGEQCAFVSADGHRCGERHALQYDHIVPLAQGGVTRADNLRLLCPAHN